jgi:tetratricopeptide (TPR) repeat protein
MSTFAGRTVRADDPRLEAVYGNFEANLRDIIRVASRAGAKTVLSTVVANLKDCPPFVSLQRSDMTDTERQAWQSAYAGALRAWELGDADAESRLRGLTTRDPGYAEAHFVMGKMREAAGDVEGARGEYLEALHRDALRFRPDPRINAAVRKVASESGSSVVLVDAASALGSDPASAASPCGRPLLLEHVHFTWKGNVLMARMLAEKAAVALYGITPPPGPWLDEEGCAKAVGFTELGEMSMLEQMEPIRGKPPFTGQLTFAEDQVRYQHELSLAVAAAAKPEVQARAAARIEAALEQNPGDANLLLRSADAQTQARHPGKVLGCIDRVLELEPRTPELLVQRARALASLQRGAEAEDAVLEALRLDPHNLPSYTALVDILRTTGDFARGRGVFEAALAGAPASGFIRLSYADLLFFHGDREEAVRQCRAVLEREPSDSDALRRLVSLYEAEGRRQDAFDLMLASRPAQPLNFENNLALAKAYEERGDEENTAALLLDAARSGPATAQVHVYLARHFSKVGRPSEAELELARGQRVALLSGDPELAGQIAATLARVRKDQGTP